MNFENRIFSEIQKIKNRIFDYGRMIRFSHTIFALPFALSALVLSNRTHPIPWDRLLWILVALAAARTAAMGFNRIVDARLDALNPRTAMRELPAGRLTLFAAVLFVSASSFCFIFAAWMLGFLPLILSLPVLLVLFGYSYTKRFTWISHLFLGFAISLAPLGAWIAATNSLDFKILWLSLALLAHIAGFDILYSCQDEDFDREYGLHSIPSRFGADTAMWTSSLIHVFAVLFLLILYITFDLGGIYLFTTGMIGILFMIEHALVKPDDLKHIHIAFFHVNASVSVVLFLGIAADEIFKF